MTPVVEGNVGIAQPGLLDFTRDIVLGVARGHQHPWQDRHDRGPARHAAIHACLNDRFGEFEETTFDNTSRVLGAKQVHQLLKFLCAFPIPAAVPDNQNGRFHN